MLYGYQTDVDSQKSEKMYNPLFVSSLCNYLT